MRMSEKCESLFGAMAKAQGEFTAAERAHTARVQSKKGDASSYTYNYADLAAYLDVVREPLSRNGLAFFQSPQVVGNVVKVITLLAHDSGQWIESDPLELTAADTTPQAVGSACTYARRYSLAAVTGMASEADDDGSAASGVPAETGRREPKPECPKCGHNKHVYEDRQKGGFFCWKSKGGCGWNWLPPSEELPEHKAQELAAEHGMTTADKLPPKAEPKTSAAYKTAIEKLGVAVRERDVNEVARIVNVADKAFADGKLPENERNGITHEASIALQKIKALENEPVAA